MLLTVLLAFSSVSQPCLTLCPPRGLQHSRLPYPSPTPGACSDSCPLSRWCHPTSSSAVVPFSSCFQSFPASGSFPVSHFFALVGQSIGASASSSVLPMNNQGWFPLGLTGLILQSKGLPGVSAGKESPCNAGDLGSIPRLGRSPGEGSSYPLQYSGLENSMDCIIYGIMKSQTQLSDFHFIALPCVYSFFHVVSIQSSVFCAFYINCRYQHTFP